MAGRAEERLSASAGLIAVLAVGISVLGAGIPISESPALRVWWWVSYAVYLGVFFLDSEILLPRPPWPAQVTPAVLLVSGLAVWLLAPDLGWTGVLFVITAATAAYTLTTPVVIAVIAVQSIAIAAGSAASGEDAANIVFITLAYLSFQVFAALVITSSQREAKARAALAIAHSDLEAATALLATSSRNDERLRIARELHDVIGHQLTALALELEVASHRAEGDALVHVTRARGIARDLLADVRATVGELRDAPARLEPTLRSLIERIPGLAVELVVDERRPLDGSRILAVVRCVQEILTNTVRHAAASHLTITVTSDVDELVVRAHDDGRGAQHVEPGNGLTGMAERAEALGGTLELESSPGQGFTVTLTVPS